jgi:hypothetical protein
MELWMASEYASLMAISSLEALYPACRLLLLAKARDAA